MSSLEKLLPEKIKCGKCYDSCKVCPHNDKCDINHHNTLLDDCLAALEGKVLVIEDLPSVDCIKDCIESYGCDMGDSFDISHKRVDELSQAIHDLIKSKAVGE